MDTFTIAVHHRTVRLDVLVADVLGCSRTHARRLIGDGAVRIDGYDGAPGLVPYRHLTCAVGDIDGHAVRIGRRQFVRPRLAKRAAGVFGPRSGAHFQPDTTTTGEHQ